MTGRYPPNRQLAWERLQRGWSREELARRIRDEMARCGEIDTGLTSNTVRRWETGQRRTEPRYRKHVVSVFGLPASELGLLTPEELALRPADDLAREVGRLVDVVSSGLAERGIDRATFVRGLLGAVATPSLLPALVSSDGGVVDRIAGLLGGGKRLDVASVDAYVAAVVGNRALYWTASPSVMFDAARGHTELGLHLLRAAADDALRRRLAAAVAESSLMAARLAFFDLQRLDAAEELFAIAHDTSRVAGDHQLAVAALAHGAFVPGFAGDFTRARSLLRAASAHANQGVGPRIRAWAHCVNAEIEARAGETRSCLHRIGLAEDALTGDGEDPDWLDYFDADRLDGFAGYCHLAADDHPRAALRLRKAVEQSAVTKQRVVLYADLAAATARTDQDEALSYLHQAIDHLEVDWYAVGYARVNDHRTYLVGDARRDEITDRLTDLTSIAT